MSGIRWRYVSVGRMRIFVSGIFPSRLRFLLASLFVFAVFMWFTSIESALASRIRRNLFAFMIYDEQPTSRRHTHPYAFLYETNTCTWIQSFIIILQKKIFLKYRVRIDTKNTVNCSWFSNFESVHIEFR